MNTVESDTQLFTVKQFCQYHKWITPGGLRWLLFRRSQNGLQESGSIIQLGRRILIDQERFLVWMRSQAGSRRS